MFKIIRFNCCGLDVYKTRIFACIVIADANFRAEYFKARFSSFPKDLLRLAAWLQEHNCKEVSMESAGRYWIPVFNALETTCKATLAHPKYTKPQKGNKTDRKDAKWICVRSVHVQHDQAVLYSAAIYSPPSRFDPLPRQADEYAE